MPSEICCVSAGLRTGSDETNACDRHFFPHYFPLNCLQEIQKHLFIFKEILIKSICLFSWRN